GYRSPLYPWMQIVGIVAPIGLIIQMGWLAIVFTSGLSAIGIAWYYGYARRRVERHGAIYHVFERLGRRRFAGLETELRSILKEKGLRAEDPFEEVVAGAQVLDVKGGEKFEKVVQRASALLAERLPCTAETLVEGFLQGTRTGATPVTAGVALPHLRLPAIDAPEMVLVRSGAGLEIATGDVFGETRTTEHSYAIFFLISPDDDPAQHLRLLAELAGRVDQEGFIAAWRAADDEHRLKEILLRRDRYATVSVLKRSPTESLIGRAIQDVEIPAECLVAVIRRKEQTIVPRGQTVVQEGDRLTIIGSAKGIRQVYENYGAEGAAPTG
ncbi:MAG: TrkA C-terminal domain-containing protein, partial [Planctomycetota bacterium]